MLCYIMKATNKGTCQICGRIQKLPDGRLSQHGYTTRWGFFSGVCCGSGQLPFEQSKDLVDGAIEGAEKRLASIQAEQETLRAPVAPGETTAWKKVHTGDLGGSWHQVQVSAEQVPYSDGRGSFTRFHRTVVKGERVPQTAWTECGNPTLEEVIRRMNSRRADDLEGAVTQLRQYCSWQRQRIAQWKPAPLLSL